VVEKRERERERERKILNFYNALAYLCM